MSTNQSNAPTPERQKHEMMEKRDNGSYAVMYWNNFEIMKDMALLHPEQERIMERYESFYDAYFGHCKSDTQTTLEDVKTRHEGYLAVAKAMKRHPKEYGLIQDLVIQVPITSKVLTFSRKAIYAQAVHIHNAINRMSYAIEAFEQERKKQLERVREFC